MFSRIFRHRGLSRNSGPYWISIGRPCPICSYTSKILSNTSVNVDVTYLWKNQDMFTRSHDESKLPWEETWLDPTKFNEYVVQLCMHVEKLTQMNATYLETFKNISITLPYSSITSTSLLRQVKLVSFRLFTCSRWISKMHRVTSCNVAVLHSSRCSWLKPARNSLRAFSYLGDGGSGEAITELKTTLWMAVT